MTMIYHHCGAGSMVR